jgi:peroxiredoxin
MKNIIKKTDVMKMLLMVTIILATGLSCSAQTNNSKLSQKLLIDGKAPGFALKDINGKIINSESFKGKFLVIHFATTWCPFCNAEAPYLEKLYKDYKEKNVQVIIIDVKEEARLVNDLLVKRFRFSFPVLLDTDGKVAAGFAPKDVLPDLSRDEVMLASNLLIDPEGNIRFFSLLNSVSFDAKLIELKSVLNALL